jgi:leader peptidase (prepilin peptidase) / N-methyltransferase
VVGIGLMMAKRAGRELQLPFGPYLAAAGWIALLWGDAIALTYLQSVGL